jgi:hypothetical protein
MKEHPKEEKILSNLAKISFSIDSKIKIDMNIVVVGMIFSSLIFPYGDVI